MSLVRTVLRLASVAALRERTWAENRVFDSDNTPLVDALNVGDVAKPYIVVFTDSDSKQDIEGADIYSATRRLELVLEIGVASIVRAENGDAVLEFPATDAAMEMVVDMVQSQALAAVLGDAQSEWGEIVRDLMFGKIERIASMRGGSSERRGRWAARQVLITTDVVADMPAGTTWPTNHPVLRFIAKAKADNVPGIVDAATLIEDMISSDAYPSWQQAQQWLGLTKRGIRGIGIAPLTDIGTGSTPYAIETGEPVTVSPDEEAPELGQTDIDDEDINITTEVKPLVGDPDPDLPPEWWPWPYYG